MVMTFADRLTIAGILPKSGNMQTMVIASDIREKVVLTQDEIVDSGFCETCYDESGAQVDVPPANGKTTVRREWKTDPEKDIEFTGAEKQLLRGLVDKADESEAVTANTVGCFRRIREM